MRFLWLVPAFLVHLLVFALAFVLFFLGLGVGLAIFPPLGMLIWAVALGIAGLNILWIFRLWRQRRRGNMPADNLQALKWWLLRSWRQGQ